MNTYRDPTPEDYEQYLVAVYFGAGATSYLSRCVKRAYLDFCRTLRSTGSVEVKDFYDKASELVIHLLEDSRNCHLADQGAFDKWHDKACLQMVKTYKGSGLSFSYGQAQKWLNMAFKYLFVLGKGRIAGYQPLYNLCHAPLDDFMLEELEKSDVPIPKTSRPWSRMKREVYLGIQQHVKNAFPGVPALTVEFWLWRAAAARRADTMGT